MATWGVLASPTKSTYAGTTWTKEPLLMPCGKDFCWCLMQKQPGHSVKQLASERAVSHGNYPKTDDWSVVQSSCLPVLSNYSTQPMPAWKRDMTSSWWWWCLLDNHLLAKVHFDFCSTAMQYGTLFYLKELLIEFPYSLPFCLISSSYLTSYYCVFLTEVFSEFHFPCICGHLTKSACANVT